MLIYHGESSVASRMRIAFFSESYGNATFIFNQYAEVSKHHDVRYFATQYAGNLPQLGTEIVIPFPSTGLENFIKRRLEWRDLYLSFHRRSFSKSIKQALTDFNPQLIHCQFGWEALILLDNFYRPDIPIVISFRGFDASKALRRRPYLDRLRHWLSKPNVHCLFVCQHLKTNLIAANIPMNGTEVIYSNTITAFFQRRERTPNTSPKIFVQVSSYAEKKGHLFTLRAFAQFRKSNPNKPFRLIFAGKTSQSTEEVRAEVARLRLEDCVEFLGYHSPIEVRDLLERSHVAVLHSVTASDGDQEGIPNALMEAMSMELPVISTWHAGIPELVEDGVHGYLVDERDIERYSLRIADIYSWNYLAENRAIIENKFSMKQHVEKLLAFYQLVARTTG